MNNKDESLKFGTLIGIFAALTTLAISPKYSYDAFSGIKLVFIAMLGSISGLYILKNFKQLYKKLGKLTTVLILLLIVDSIAILLLNDINYAQAFFGVSGRYTGFLSFLALILILTSSANVSNFVVRKIILNCFILCGILNVIYALYQFSGRDIVAWDSSTGSKVIGFLGNPNFISSFLALSAIAMLTKILDGKRSLIHKFLCLILIIGSIIGLIGANSTQGFLILLLGFAIVLYFYSQTKFKTRLPSRIILGGLMLGFMGGLLDIFQKSPWNPFLYGETISIRGDYWRAGWNMALENPILGVGFDGYLNHYRRSRDLVASTRLGSDIPTDAAHNVLLDYAANGGLIFLLLNLLLLILILKSGLEYIRQEGKFDTNFIAIFAIWIGFTTQSIISINQLGLAVWGWVLGGLVLGARQIRKSEVSENTTGKKFSSNNFKHNSGYLMVVLSMFIGLLVSLPVFLADHNFKSALDSKKALDLYNSANSWPPITKKMVLVAAVLDQNKVYKEAKVLSERTIRINPDSFEAWIIFSQNPLVSEVEMQEIKRQLLRLDPNISKLGGIDKYLNEKFDNASP